MIYDSVVHCIGQTPLVYLHRLFPRSSVDIIAKLEFLNPGGSIKDRPARFIIEQGLRDGRLYPGSHIIESTPGNFGIALMMVARLYNIELNFRKYFCWRLSGFVAAALQKLVPTLPPSSRVLTLLSDRGDHYLDTIYSEQWIQHVLDERNDLYGARRTGRYRDL